MLDKILPKLKEQGARVVLFALATKTLDILEEYLQIRYSLKYRIRVFIFKHLCLGNIHTGGWTLRPIGQHARWHMTISMQRNQMYLFFSSLQPLLKAGYLLRWPTPPFTLKPTTSTRYIFVLYTLPKKRNVLSPFLVKVVNHGMKIVSYPGKFLPITVIRLLAKVHTILPYSG